VSMSETVRRGDRSGTTEVKESIAETAVYSMGIAGYVSSACSFTVLGFHCLSLHVSAYTAILRCVGFFIYFFSYA
jgi:hypothetical protein